MKTTLRFLLKENKVNKTFWINWPKKEGKRSFESTSLYLWTLAPEQLLKGELSKLLAKK
jgi:hypothetical protein